MLKKLFLVAVTLFAFAAASFATDYVRIDLNYYCRGTLKCLSPQQKGVQIVQRRDYPNGKHPDKCYYSITVNLEKIRDVALEFEVIDTGDKERANIVPSISPIRLADGKRDESIFIECLEFEFADQSSSSAPCKINKWTRMVKSPLAVSTGDKFTNNAKVNKVED